MKIAIKPNKIELNFQATKVYPELEDLEVTPSTEEQNFKSSKYGYNKVKVKKIETTELNITPSSEEQVKEGIFDKITVVGDSNLVEENIKEGVEIFGVVGNAKTTSAKITDASYLFYKEARINSINEFLALCEHVTNMASMFYSCSNLTSLDLSNFDTSNVTDMSYMFASCNKLQSLDVSNFDTSNVTNMDGMFNFCSKLESLDLSNFDMSKVNNIYHILYRCSDLTDISSFKNLGKAFTQKTNNYSNYKLDLSYSTKLTHDSLMNLINNLYNLNLTYDVENGGTLYTQQLVLGSTNLAKLTAEEIAIATSKRVECNLSKTV